jgi:uncharacterized membrane protein YwaF
VSDTFAWIGLNAHSFGDLKNLIVDGVGIQRDALHIHFGLLIFMVAAWALKGPRRYIRAVWLLLAIALGAEIWDHIYERSIGKSCDWPDHLSDLFNTCIWPLLLALFWRWKAKSRP